MSETTELDGDDFPEWETVATFEHDSKTYELDDLKNGSYAIYLNGEQVGDFHVLGGDAVDLPTLASSTDSLTLAAHAAIPGQRR